MRRNLMVGLIAGVMALAGAATAYRGSVGASAAVDSGPAERGAHQIGAQYASSAGPAIVDANDAPLFAPAAPDEALLAAAQTLPMAPDRTEIRASRRGGLAATALPEPATWAMLFIGFGAIGVLLRANFIASRELADLQSDEA